MKTTHREEFLIQYLLKQSSFVTVASLTEQMEISPKTVYRMIKKLNDCHLNGKLIQTEKGKGIRLNYDAYLESRFNRKDSTEKTRYNYSPIERHMHILKELLFHSPASIRESELFDRYYLSPSAIYTDEDILQQQLQQLGLKLEKKDNRLSVIGSENLVRRALIKLLMKLDILNFDDLQSIAVDFNKNDLRFVIRQLEFIEERIGSIIPAPYNINLLTHLYILIYRIRKGSFDYCEQTDMPNDNTQDAYYPIAQQIKESIEGYLCKKLPTSETANIYCYLSGARMEPQIPAASPHITSEVQQVTNFYIQEFSRLAKTPMQAGIIHNELASHIKPMLNRLKSGLIVKNGLLDNIRQEYNHLFTIVRQVSDAVPVKFSLPKIDDDEAGFITLYFARYMELHPRQVRVFIVCTTGMGTSELLKVKIQRFFPEIDVIATLSAKTVTKAYLEEQKIDLVLTTIKIEDGWSVPVVLVNTLFIEKDKEKVRHILKELTQS
ncbi:BglG family transcription antiterminator [Anaerosinus massiliensis]|uniref:BglG family transcription antiterminator n=1 Tax=Massilibacillus massiliensis TaxID=1806837 RepID=UPI000ACADC4C|nr:PRD domain-containing protein [Massilibacillus massiliensis]